MQNIKTILYLASGILFGLFLAALVWVVSRTPTGEAVVKSIFLVILADLLFTGFFYFFWP